MKQRIILGPPGCGKTTYLLNMVQDEMAGGVHPSRIAYVSFTRKATQEARGRALERFNATIDDFPFFKTLHSLAYQQLGLNKSQVMGSAQFRMLGEALGLVFSDYMDMEEGAIPVSAKNGDTARFIVGMARATLTPLEEQFKRQPVSSNIEWYQVKQFADTLAKFKVDTGMVDFSDMLDSFLQECQPLDIDVAFVDEAQDLSKQQWQMLRHAISKAKRVYIAGDDDQCQPAGCLVETTDGEVDIAELSNRQHRLLAYDRVGSAIYGKRKGYAFAKAMRKYTGRMYTLTADGKTSRSTRNHIWLVKWNPEIKQRGLCCTYIMRRGDWFRVGWCQLFRQDGCFHLNVRTNGEKADAVWILSVFNDRTDASIDESVVAARYGIPTMPFEPIDTATHITREAIDRVFSVVDSMTGALRALADHGRCIEHPFINRLRENYSRYGATINEVRACNLLGDGLMLLPVRISGRTHDSVKWEPLQLTYEQVRGVPVYSLDVEKYHTYIVDGLVTHNCIFQWSGADVGTFLALEGERLVLDQSYRLPYKVHCLCIDIASRISNRIEKQWRSRDDPGEVGYLPHVHSMEWQDGSYLMLARNKYLLERYEQFVRACGVPYTIGNKSSLDNDAVEAIRSWEYLRAGRALPASQVRAVYAKLRSGEGIKRGHKTLKGVADETMLTMADLKRDHGLLRDDVWHDALTMIDENDREFMVAALRRREKITATPRVHISTVHGAKGGEADHVVMLSDVAGRTYAESRISPDDEHRVAYVAASRARKSLTIILPQTPRSYDFP